MYDRLMVRHLGVLWNLSNCLIGFGGQRRGKVQAMLLSSFGADFFRNLYAEKNNLSQRLLTHF
jgi:hypothetical protein